MNPSKCIDLYVRYYRLTYPVIIVTTALLWVTFGQRVALTVMCALVAVDMAVLGIVVFRSIKQRK